MQLELDEREADLLVTALRGRIEDLTWELSRTEQHGLRHELAQLVVRLELMVSRIENVQAQSSVGLGALSDR
jgi:hypothetical protein